MLVHKFDKQLQITVLLVFVLWELALTTVYECVDMKWFKNNVNNTAISMHCVKSILTAYRLQYTTDSRALTGTLLYLNVVLPFGELLCF